MKTESTPTAPTQSQLEQRVMQAIEQSFAECITKKFEGYNSPLDDLLKRVITSRQSELIAVMDAAMASALQSKDFKATLCEAFDKKLAKVLLGNFEGEVERRAGKLREDPVFRAKITTAIDAAIKSVSP